MIKSTTKKSLAPVVLVSTIVTLTLVALAIFIPSFLAAFRMATTQTSFPLTNMPAFGNMTDVCLATKVTDKPACYQALFKFACSQPIAILGSDAKNTTLNPFVDARITVPCVDFCKFYFSKMGLTSENDCRAKAINFVNGNLVISANLNGTPNLSLPLKTDPNKISFNSTNAQKYCLDTILALGMDSTHNWYNSCLNNVTNFLNAAAPTVDGYTGYKRFLIDRYRNANPVCGNSIIEGPEVCDDGDKDDHDGCRNDCTKTPAWDMTGLNETEVIVKYFETKNPSFVFYVINEMQTNCSKNPTARDCRVTCAKAADYNGCAGYVCQNYPSVISTTDPKYISCMKSFGITIPTSAPKSGVADATLKGPNDIVSCDGLYNSGWNWMGTNRSNCTLDQATKIYSPSAGGMVTLTPYHYCFPPGANSTCTYYFAQAIGKKESAIVDVCVKQGSDPNAPNLPGAVGAACTSYRIWQQLCCNQIGYGGYQEGGCGYVAGEYSSFPICAQCRIDSNFPLSVARADSKDFAPQPVSATKGEELTCPANYIPYGDFCCRPEPYQTQDSKYCKKFCNNKQCMPGETLCPGDTSKVTRASCCNAGQICVIGKVMGVSIGKCVNESNKCDSASSPGYCGTSKDPNTGKDVYVCCSADQNCQDDLCMPKAPGNCPSGKTFCQGVGGNSKYSDCCKSGEICSHHLNGMPLCAVEKF